MIYISNWRDFKIQVLEKDISSILQKILQEKNPGPGTYVLPSPFDKFTKEKKLEK